jgi:phosphoglycolate phosphatase
LYQGTPEGIIFDCDGVIIDSREANITYYNYLRKYIGLPALSKEQEDFVQAATVQQAIDAIFPKPLQPLLRDASKRISYTRDIMPHITYYPGLHAVLDYCRKVGIKLGIDTNRIDGMDILMDTCRLHGYFDPIILASHVIHPKPHAEGALCIAKGWNINPKHLLFVGDSNSDKGAANNAEIPFLSFKTKNLSTHTVEDFSTLLQALCISNNA